MIDKETEIMARMNALNNATTAMQVTLEKFKEIQNIEDVADKIIEIAEKKFLKFILEPLYEQQENPFIMVYIDKKQGGKEPSEYDDIFTKHGFKKTEKGGYYARLRQQEWNEILQKYEWLPKAVEIKTEMARKQEDEK